MGFVPLSEQSSKRSSDLVNNEETIELHGLAGNAAYLSLATTNSGAQSKARLISESGKVQIEFWADSA